MFGKKIKTVFEIFIDFHRFSFSRDFHFVTKLMLEKANGESSRPNQLSRIEITSDVFQFFQIVF